MNNIFKSVAVLMIVLGFAVQSAFAQESITTVTNLEQAIQEMGYEEAVVKALQSGVLSMEQIATTVFANTQDLNPVQVVAVLYSTGVPKDTIINAASNAGVSPGIVNAGIQRGEGLKSASANVQPTTGEAGLGFSEGLITNPPPPKPPTVVTGQPGGRDPKPPVSPSSRI